MTNRQQADTFFWIQCLAPIVIMVDYLVNSGISVENWTNGFYIGISISTVLLVVVSAISAPSLRGALFNSHQLMAYSCIVMGHYAVYWVFLANLGHFTTPHLGMLIAILLMIFNFYVAVWESYCDIREKTIDSISELPFGKMLLSLIVFPPIIYASIYGRQLQFENLDALLRYNFVFGLICLGFFLDWVKQAIDYKLLNKRKTLPGTVLDSWFDNNMSNI